MITITNDTGYKLELDRRETTGGLTSVSLYATHPLAQHPRAQRIAQLNLTDEALARLHEATAPIEK